MVLLYGDIPLYRCMSFPLPSLPPFPPDPPAPSLPGLGLGLSLGLGLIYIHIYTLYIYIYIYNFLHVTRTKLKQLYVWYCTNELYIQLYVCLPLYIYISYIKCNVVTVYERILICFIIYRNAILTFLTLFDKYVFEKKF